MISGDDFCLRKILSGEGRESIYSRMTLLDLTGARRGVDCWSGSRGRETSRRSSSTGEGVFSASTMEDVATGEDESGKKGLEPMLDCDD